MYHSFSPMRVAEKLWQYPLSQYMILVSPSVNLLIQEPNYHGTQHHEYGRDSLPVCTAE